MDSENDVTLDGREEQFCHEYLIDLNGTKAAIRAEYSENGASVQAHRLLRKAKIRKRIAELRKQMASSFDVTKERILQELSCIAFNDPRAIFKEDGSLKNIHEINNDAAAAIAGVESLDEFEGSGEDRKKIGELKKIKFWDKTKAIESINKMLGYNAPEKHALTDPDGNPVTIFQLPDNGRGNQTA